MPPAIFTEKDIISCIRKWAFIHPEQSLNLQDDCAFLPPTDKATLISTDALIEGTHYRRDWSSPKDLARKLLNVNLSDLASKGGRPLGFLFSWGLSPSWSFDEVEIFCRELGAYSREMNCPLLGGNTSRAAQNFLNLTVLGSLSSPTLKWRGAAKPGDLICVTGSLGDARAGLEVLSHRVSEKHPALRESQLQGKQRLAEGKFLAAADEVHAMMDISDGLRRDLSQMAEVSHLGFEIDASKLPISKALKDYAGARASAYALAGGEDYELLIAMSESGFVRLQAELQQRALAPLSLIGRFNSGWDKKILNAPELLPTFEHFE